MKFRLLLIFIFYSTLSHAQLCNNNLGDPIINIDFGIAHFPQYPNKTTYNLGGGCPSKGYYSIADFLFGCGGFWVQMTGDHTPPPDLNGNYMLVNAEETPGYIHIDTAKGLCGGMTYQYSAYITNVMQDKLTCPNGNTVLPNLVFNIESLSGKVLASYNTGDIPITNIKEWKQYGFTYTNTTNESAVVLKMWVNSKAGCGNAFAIDDIVFQSCGPAVNVTIDGTTANQNVCAGYTNPFLMHGSYSGGFNDPVVQWQNSVDTGRTWIDIPGATTTSYQVPHRSSDVIEYRMVVAERQNINSPNCRMRSNAIYTEIHPIPVHQQTQYVNGCTGRDYLLPAASTEAFEILWTGPNGFKSDERTGAYIPDFEFADTGLYKLKQTYDYGCVDLDSFYISASPGIILSVQPSSPICEGESEQLNTSASVAGAFKWIPNAGLSNDTISSPIATPLDSTIYKVVVTNSYGCQDSAELPVYVYKRPVVNAGPDKTVVIGDTATLLGSVEGTKINYYWSPPSYLSDPSAIQSKAYPLQDMTYTLTGSSTLGCGEATDEVNVTVYQGFFIPNSFTPNGDGKNDKFRITPYDNYQLLKFLIYNRWGAVVFRSSTLDNGWDGNLNNQPQPMGAYIYYVELLDPHQKKIIKRGTLTLLR